MFLCLYLDIAVLMCYFLYSLCDFVQALVNVNVNVCAHTLRHHLMYESCFSQGLSGGNGEAGEQLNT